MDKTNTVNIEVEENVMSTLFYISTVSCQEMKGEIHGAETGVTLKK